MTIAVIWGVPVATFRHAILHAPSPKLKVHAFVSGTRAVCGVHPGALANGMVTEGDAAKRATVTRCRTCQQLVAK